MKPKPDHIICWKCEKRVCEHMCENDDKFSRFKKFIQENRKTHNRLGLVQAWIREFESKEEGEK